MKHQPERTCIGCRGVFAKDQVVRIVAGPEGPLLDYREKLPGRAGYVCPNRECIEMAMTRGNLSRALKLNVKPPAPEIFMEQLSMRVNEKIESLVAMAAKAGKLAAGYSAVQDALEKGRVNLLLYASDISDGTREKVEQHGGSALRRASALTRGTYGRALGRELVGVVAFEDKGLADAVWNETERLKSLIKKGR